MLRITVEVVPGGYEGAKRTLSTVYVGNDGTGSSNVGNYDVYLEDPRHQDYPRAQRKGWIGRIENFNRHVFSRGRDNLSSLALYMATGKSWDVWTAANGAKIRPGGWVVLRGCGRTHFLLPSGVTACRNYGAWRVHCREGELSPPHCKACEKAVARWDA